MKYIKLFENTKDWNQVLRDATWTHKEIVRNKIWYMDFDKIKLAVENGAEVDSCHTLFWAEKMNNLEVVKYMLEHGADVEDTDDSGKWTPLMSAALDGNVDIAKILIDYDADPFIGNFQGNTTMDILTPGCKKLQGASFNYESVSKKIQRKRDEIRKYIKDNSIHMKIKDYNL
jgi:ankyrin repeat protein